MIQFKYMKLNNTRYQRFIRHGKTNFQTNTHQTRLHAGFIRTILLTVVGLALLNIMFGIDIVDYLDKERLLIIWNDTIAGPLLYLWNNIVIGIIWNFIEGLFS